MGRGCNILSPFKTLAQADKALEYWEKAKEKGEGSGILDKKISEKKVYE